MTTTTHQTYCRNCPALCGLLLDVVDNQIVKLRGDRDNPLTDGYFCTKGAASKLWHNGDDRLFGSLARQPDGRSRPIETEQALDEVAARLDDIIARYGADSVGMYFGTGAGTNALAMSALRAWFDRIGSPYLFSSMTVDQSAKWVAASRAGIFATGKFSSLDADLIILLGTNPLVSHTTFGMPMTNPAKGLREARMRGMKLYVVDPRETETARLADLHVSIRPGEDAALLAGMIRTILARGWHDARFCDRFVTQIDDLARSVAPFDPDTVFARTGVDPETQEQLAADFAHARRRSIFSGTGPNMTPHSNMTEHLIEALHAICGAYVRGGDVIRNVGLLYGSGVAQEKVIPPNRSWESGPHCRTADVGQLFGEFPTSMIPAEIEGDGKNRLRALIVVGGNPLKALGSPQRTKAAFESLDLLVSLAPRRSETTDLSHYTIATAPMYERYDFTGLLEPMLTLSYARIAKPVVAPPEGVISDLAAFWGLARRMGFSLRLKPPGFGIPYAQAGDRVLELDQDQQPDEEEIVRWMVSQGSTTYDELVDQPHGLLRPDLVKEVVGATEDDGVRLELCPADVAQEIAAFQNATPPAGFEYRLTSRRMLEVMNSAYINSAAIQRKGGGNPAYFCPEDMAREGLSDDDIVEIESPYGRIVTEVRKDARLRPGVISMTHSWGSVTTGDRQDDAKGAFTGHLVSLDGEAVEAINRMPWQSAIPVRLRRLAG